MWHTGRGTSETRSRHFGALSPIRKLILVRSRMDDCCPEWKVEHAGETGVSLAPLAGHPERNNLDASTVSSCCGLHAADRPGWYDPPDRAHLWDHDGRSLGTG